MHHGLRRFADSRGFSVTEVSTILMAMAILSGTMAPSAVDFIDQAKQVRVRHDVRTLAVTLVRLINDVGAGRVAQAWAPYRLLVGPGDPPAATPDDIDWQAVGADVGSLDHHLLTNDAAYRPAPGPAGAWRGPYLEQPVKADPWGHRYALNTASATDADVPIVVLSAGADGEVDVALRDKALAVPDDDAVSLVATRSTRW